MRDNRARLFPDWGIIADWLLLPRCHLRDQCRKPAPRRAQTEKGSGPTTVGKEPTSPKLPTRKRNRKGRRTASCLEDRSGSSTVSTVGNAPAVSQRAYRWRVITSCAEQLAVEPPSLPAQDHAQGPLPETDEAVPVLQRPVVGAWVKFLPFGPPQLPFV